MLRWLFDGLLVGLLAFVPVACVAQSQTPGQTGQVGQAERGRPNFVFIITDDQRWDILGCVQKEQGDAALFPWFKTPHLDRLAAEGARFRNAFVVHSLCSPSRASFLSGVHTHQHGVKQNRTPMPTDLPTWAHSLGDAGYDTAYFGKWHMGRQSERPGFATIFSYNGQGKYFDTPFFDNGKKTPTRGWVDDVTTNHAIAYLRENQDKPFGMVIGYKSPHEPRRPPARRANDFADAPLNPPASHFNVPPFRPEGYQPLKWETRLKDRRNYFRCVAAIDDCVGRLMDELDALGLADDTVLVFAGDNGYYLGEHASHDKRSAYEESLRIPFLVRYPRLVPPGTLIDDVALNVDLAPTILELAGRPTLEESSGKSLVNLLRTPPAAGPTDRAFLYENHRDPEFPKVTFDILALRTATDKLITYPGHPDWSEAFNLTLDPNELRDVYDDPGFATQRDQLVRQLNRRLMDAGLDPAGPTD